MHIKWQSCLEAKLAVSEVHIWRAFLSSSFNKLSYYWSILSEEEKIYANQFHFSPDKIRYTIARGGLRSVLSNYIKVGPQVIQFEYSEHGKPHLIRNQNNQKIRFNLSHSGDCVVYALTKNVEIGIDLEYPNEHFEWEELANAYFSEQECDKVKNLSIIEKNAYFYNLWTLKEALTKALGEGLRYDLRQFSIDLNIEKENCTIHFLKEIDSQESFQWVLQVFKPHPGYYAAFATNQLVKKTLYFEMDCAAVYQ